MAIPEPLKQQYDYSCTECGGDATVGMSNFKKADGTIIIEEKERLCLICSRKRGVNFMGR